MASGDGARHRRLPAIGGGSAADAAFLTLVGAVVRLIPFLGTDFPLHDGGMFLRIIEDIRANGMGLPEHISYNGGVIPFDYPPLAFLVAAALPLDPISILRLIPLVATILVVSAFYLVAREFFPDRRHVFGATLIFALLPRSWEYLLAGGGLTRAPGLLAAMIAIWQLIRVYRSGRARNVVAAGIAGGLAFLLHPEATVFVGCTSWLFAAAWIRNRKTLVNTAAVYAMGAIVVLPFVVHLVLSGHVGSFLGAGSLGVEPVSTILTLITLRVGDEIAFPITLFLACVGSLVLLRRRDLVLPAWLLLEVVLAARGAPTYAAVPMALTASVGLQEGVVQDLLGRPVGSDAHRRAAGWVTAGAVVWLTLNIPLDMAIHRPPFDVLSAGDRQAMTWARTGTPQDARFVDVSGLDWSIDIYGEWLPALSDRVSDSTMQGYEWIGSSVWSQRLVAYDDLQACVRADAACVSDWLARHEARSDMYVYVPNADPSSALLESIRSSPDFQVVLENDSALVAHWLPGGP